MYRQDPKAWMLADAIEMIEGADRLRRQFFRIGVAEEGASWEPPVDMCSNDSALAVLVALPGVAPDDWAVTLEDDAIVVRGERSFGAHFGSGSIVLLEIPYGRFERRISLPDGDSYRMVDMQLEHGCLRLHLERFK
jgi:HSP20 family protein